MWFDSEGLTTNPLIRFGLIRGLAVGFVIAYPLLNIAITRLKISLYSTLLFESCLERVDDIIVEFLPRESLAVGLTSKVATSGGDTIDRGR